MPRDRQPNFFALLTHVAATAVAIVAMATPVRSQQAPSPRPETVMRAPLGAPAGAAVTRDDLAPVMAGDGSGLPFELWRGLDVTQLESLISELEIPPKSPALHGLWKRLITSNVTPASGSAIDMKFTALRLEALYRSGLADEAAKDLARQNITNDPILSALAARNELASGNASKACEIMQQSAALKTKMPARLRAQAILMSGYCAAVSADAAGAGLAAELAREEGLAGSPGLDALDAISVGAKAKIAPFKSLSLLDYRIAEKAGGVGLKDVLEKAEPALLVALANDPQTPADLGLPASEAASKLNGLTPETLAAIYRANGQTETAETVLAQTGTSSIANRAAMFKAAEAEKTPMKKTRLIGAFLDQMKRQGLGFQAMQMIAPATQSLTPQPELSWFAETAAEIGVASGKLDMARQWVRLASTPDRPNSNLAHWLALADIADPNAPNRGADLVALEPLATSGRFPSAALHRLATVLDALNYNVPIPLWDAASRTPQPDGGYLPATGVLSELQDAAKKKEYGRTVLLAMKTLGPNGAEGAHMIALGDAIRALKRAGLEPDARRLGLEALLAAWPRNANN